METDGQPMKKTLKTTASFPTPQGFGKRIHSPSPVHEHHDSEEVELEVPLDHGTSFIAHPSGPEALNFVRHLVSSENLTIVKAATDLQAIEAMSLNFMQALVWGGEVTGRICGAMERASSSQKSMNDVLSQHEELMKRMEDLHMKHEAEKVAFLAELKFARAHAQVLEDKAAWAEQKALNFEEQLRKKDHEAEAMWLQKKEKFIHSSEFYSLCSDKETSYFEHGINGGIAQIRANGYSEAEHHFSFLDVFKALEDMPEKKGRATETEDLDIWEEVSGLAE
ncbi:uncharacterized protein [Primulina eburnea]|uniref:uncharacterized protein n=1 Tax=Primulina eburnea TaxID=1245227 RepID=UPI003C6C4DE6